MNKTRIDWTDRSWNVVTGCSHGCGFCYARRMSTRFHRSFEPMFHSERLEQPMWCKTPSKIFACSMGDLFDPMITDEQIDDVFQVMAVCQQHIFQVLTKRPDRMRQWAETLSSRRPIPGRGVCTGGSPFCTGAYCKTHEADVGYCGSPWPLPNVWLGTSLTGDDDRQRAWRLLQTPAAVRFISYEPALAPLDLNRWELICRTWRKGATIGRYLDWVIVGGQTGPSAKPPRREWIQDIVDQCQAEGVAVFLKSNLAKVWDDELIQEFPTKCQP